MNEEAVVIERVFDAPIEKVWQAWTDPEIFKQWWGPKDFTGKVNQLDVRVGGKFHGAMHGPAGTEFDKDFWGTGTYKEVELHKKLVFTDSFADEEGNIVPATHYGMSEDFPMEMLVTVIFEEQDGKTKLTLRHEGHPAGEDAKNAKQGWNESLDKMAAVIREA